MCSKNEMDAALWMTKSTSACRRARSAAPRLQSFACTSPSTTTIFSMTARSAALLWVCCLKRALLLRRASSRSGPAYRSLVLNRSPEHLA